MAERENFGTLPSGETVERLTIRGGGLTARVLTFGSVIQDLRLEGHPDPLVLGLHSLADYLVHSPFFGATPGRCANRIAGGQCTVDGHPVQLERNERGVNHLHGGSDGIAVRNWTVEAHEEDRVVMSIVDPDGRAGYPGNCGIQVEYALEPGGRLAVRYRAETDAATLANICQHSYFNLDGAPDILGHELTIHASTYLPVDANLIPTGEQRSVDGGPFDFRSPKIIGSDRQDGRVIPYDHNFCLSPGRTAKRHVARLRSPRSGVVMDVETTEPGVQFYAGGKIDVPVSGLAGKPYGACAGLCLETQVWPDAINHEGFPNAVLRPGETLIQETDYIFTR